MGGERSGMKHKLICLDMDGVIFKDAIFWMRVHEVLGTLKEGKRLTKKYLDTDYDKLVEEVVVKLWKGKDAQAYYDLVQSIEYLPGVKELFTFIKERNFISAIVSAGSIDLARRVQRDFLVDYLFANELVIENNMITGEFLFPIGPGGKEKARVIKHLCEDLDISLDEVIYVGDSSQDILATKVAGLGIAFNSDCKELKKNADHVVDGNDLRDVVRVLSE
jgi:phosphoserine phosphatase